MGVCVEPTYRSGQFAKLFKTSSYHVRKLLEAGLLEGELTDGQQWRIPLSEIARFEKSGLPPIPQTTNPSPPAAEPPRNNGGHEQQPEQHQDQHDELLAPPSDELIGAHEESIISGHKLQTTRNRVESWKLRREAAEVEDFFKARERREMEAHQAERTRREQLAEQERQRREQLAERERRRLAAEQAERKRTEWRRGWIEYALRSRPWDAPKEYELDIGEEVGAELDKHGPDEPDHIIRRLVDGAIDRALRPWRQCKENEEAVQDACRSAPYPMQSDAAWRHRLIQVAAGAIAGLRESAGYQEKLAAGTLALSPLIAEHEHQQRCRSMADGAWRLLPAETTYQERCDASAPVREALAQLPIGATATQMEAARDEALKPLCTAIAARVEREVRQSVTADASLPWGLSQEDRERALTEIRVNLNAHTGAARPELEKIRDRICDRYRAEHDSQKQRRELIEAGLAQIYSYLLKLADDYEFDKSPWSLVQELKEPVREALEQALDGTESAEELAKLTRRLVREELDL